MPCDLDSGSSAAQSGVAEVIEQVAVNVVGAGLGDGVHLAAGGLPQLSGIIAGGHLILFHRIQAEHVGAAECAAASFGEERLVVIGAVHRIAVVQARDSAVRDQTAGAIGGHVRREEHEGVPAPASDGKTADCLIAYHLRIFGLLGVDHGGFASDRDFLLNALHRETEIDGYRLPHLQHQVLVQDAGEAGLRCLDLIVAWPEESRRVVACVGSLRLPLDAGVGIAMSAARTTAFDASVTAPLIVPEPAS
jgi:hypothetical protein